MNALELTREQIVESNRENQKGIMIATPMYGGMCTGTYTLSAINTALMLHELFYYYHFETLINESLIPRGRNTLVRSFMANPKLTHLMFIDADIGFRPKDLLKLILHDKDVVAGVYPKKRINWPVVKRAVMAGKEDLAAYTGDFVFNLLNPNDDPQENGLLEVKHAGTGFMMIKKQVFEKMQGVVPEYKELMEEGDLREGVEYFQTGVDDNGFYSSEDYRFCDIWRKLGGQVFIDPYIKLSHVGTYEFSGDLERLGTETL
jgi:hypothetical protein